MRRLKIAALIGVFLAAIVAANLIATHYGPSASIYIAFFLIGLDFASMVAFSAAELVETVAYHFLRKRQWVERAPKAALLAAAVDFLIFPTIAFNGILWSITAGQFFAKIAGAAVWTWIVARLLPPPSMAPEKGDWAYVYPATKEPF